MYKYKRNGFTLVELMAVIIIISLIALLTFPNIINQIKKSKKSNNEMIEDVIIEQAKKYVSDNEDEFQDDDGYCLSIDTLVDKGYVNEQLVDINNKDTDVIMMIKKDDFSYKIVNKNDCDISEYQNIFVDSEGKKYERVEYLESTGIQYIDTGFTSNTPEAGYYIKYQNSQDHSGDDNVMGVISPNRVIGTPNKKASAGWKQSGVGSDGSASVDVLSTDIIETWLNYENNNIKKISLNGEDQKSESISIVTSTNNLSCYIFASNLNGNAYGNASGVRVYAAKISLNSEIVRDYIPVLDKNNRPCLFDKVGKKCYYNQGTGEFGFPIREKGYRKINYLESTGTQYIDTGFTSNTPEAGYYIKYQNSQDHSGDDNVMGVIYPNRVIATSNKKASTGWKQSGFGSDGSTVIDVLSTDIIETWLNYENNNISKISLNGEVQKSENISTVTSTNNLSCYIFASNLNGNAYGNASGVRIYAAKISLNNKIVRDYIPVLDKNGMPCLYEKIEGKFYYNKGTGEFLYG